MFLVVFGLNHFGLKRVQSLLVQLHWKKIEYLLCSLKGSNVWRQNVKLADIYWG